MIAPVPAGSVLEAVPALTPWIRKACSRGGGLNPRTLVDEARRGGVEMWVVAAPKGADDWWRGVAFTRLERWQEATVLRVLCVGGENMSAWLGPFRQRMRDRARQGGAEKIVTEGRKGWGRVLGLTPVRFVFEEKL